MTEHIRDKSYPAISEFLGLKTIKRGILSLIESRQENHSIIHNVFPNKIKIKEKLNTLGTGEYGLILYYPLEDFHGLTEIGGYFLCIYQEQMYYFSPHDMIKKGFSTEEYDSAFNDTYDAKYFLKNAQVFSISDFSYIQRIIDSLDTTKEQFSYICPYIASQFKVGH